MRTRREFFYSAAMGLAAAAVPAFELEEVTLADLAAGLQRGRWTSEHLVAAYLQRIEAIDRRGPNLRAVIELNPEASAIAAQLDAERKSGQVRGPLHGVPIFIKDNIATADRMSTTAGSMALDGWHADRDAWVAARLRAAGAILLGKTNLSEWANFRSTHSISGWSGRGGQTRNPYALHRNPSGSSSGSGAAVAASLCAAAVGTETDGSVVSPSSVNGIVGLKPTVGVIGRSGIIPISHTQDTAGPMARTVRDVAMLLNALAGVDSSDVACIAATGHIATDYTQFLQADGLRGARVGIARKFFDHNAMLDAFLSGCVEQLKKLGAEIVDPADLPLHGQWAEAEGEVMYYEFKSDLNRYLQRLPADRHPRTLVELIDFNERNRGVEMPWFGQELFHMAQAKGPLTDKEYMDARTQCLQTTRDQGIDMVMERNKLDALVSLTNGPAWLIDNVDGDQDPGGCSSPAAIAGYPHITVPAGFYRDLPVGLSFFGPAWSEPVLLKLAYAWETATKARRKPQFLTGVELPVGEANSAARAS